MTGSKRSLRLLLAIVALAALVAVIALPALAADPSSSPSGEPSATATGAATATVAPTAGPTAEPVATAEPAGTAAPVGTDDGDDGGTQMPEQPPKPDKPDNADKAKGAPVTVTGTVGTRNGTDGHVAYTLDTGSAVLVLEAGPPWFYGDDHPLKAHVGKRVTIVGEQRAGEDEVDVETVDGVRIREPGKPPWAGGWKAVGERHPGWSEEKAARWGAKRAEQTARHGTSCWPPGHCKGGATADDGAAATNPPGD